MISKALTALFFFLFALPVTLLSLSVELGVKGAIDTMLEDIK